MDDPSLGPVTTGVKAVFGAMATGFVSHSGVAPIDDLFSRGGMASMLTTIWLVLGALCFFMREPPRPSTAPTVGSAGPGYWDVLKTLVKIRSFVLCCLGMTATTFMLGGVAAW